MTRDLYLFESLAFPFLEFIEGFIQFSKIIFVLK